ncbi:MAG TPA: cytochrome c oxidase assembly protein [Gemmatimonadota bacterium]|nr:cytochrome c oxidase assembly protein [Gemmatimonadota bacterium]
MTWWCSARGTAWDWTWQAYPGVWLFIGLLAVGYLALAHRAAAAGDDPVDGRRRATFFGGLAILWLALDWPIGALGAGYLASVHMVQFLMIALLAPPLMLMGLPRGVYTRLGERRRAVAALRFVTHPLIALAVFGVVVYWTHLPGVVDVLMVTQAGSFALDLVWLLGGFVFWWPVVAPVPERPGFPAGLKMGYLFLATVINTLPYAFLTFGDLPFYGLYELAPPVSGITTRQDQQIAGLLMKMGGGVILWTAITILFFRWFQQEDAGSTEAGSTAGGAG